jgi:hypothetical protein
VIGTTNDLGHMSTGTPDAGSDVGGTEAEKLVSFKDTAAQLPLLSTPPRVELAIGSDGHQMVGTSCNLLHSQAFQGLKKGRPLLDLRTTINGKAHDTPRVPEGAPSKYTAISSEGSRDAITCSHLNHMLSLKAMNLGNLEFGDGVMVSEGLFIITAPGEDTARGGEGQSVKATGCNRDDLLILQEGV